MTKGEEPRRARIDGEDVVVLIADEYDRLAASRRQVAAQSAQLHSLKQSLLQARTLLEELDTAADDMHRVQHLLATRPRALAPRANTQSEARR